MKIKEKDDWTSLSLTIAVMAFVFLTYFTFIGFMSTKPESNYVVYWFLMFIEKYGAFLAAVPVMIGVAVAKQQLDANRKQHYATVKRSLKKEVDALEGLIEFAKSVKTASSVHSIMSFKQQSLGGIPIDLPSIDAIKKMEEFLSVRTIDAAKNAREAAEVAIIIASDDYEDEDFPDGVDSERIIEIAKATASTLYFRSMRELNSLSQYWS